MSATFLPHIPLVATATAPTTETSGFVAPTPAPEATTGFAAGVPTDHTSGDIPTTTKLLSNMGLLSDPTFPSTYAPVTGGGLASSPNVAALGEHKGVHSEGMTRAEMLGKKAEVVSGVKLEEMAPHDQAAAQLTGIHKPTLLEDAKGLLGQAGAAAYNVAPAVVKRQLDEVGLKPAPGATPESPIKGPITSAGITAGRRASAAFEQAKHLIATGETGVNAPVSTSATTNDVPLAPRAIPETSVFGKAGRRASGLFAEVKKEFVELRNEFNVNTNTPPGTIPVTPTSPTLSGTSPVRRTSQPVSPKPAFGTEPSLVDRAQGLFSGVVSAIQTELNGGTGKTLPSQEILGATKGVKSDGVGALPGTILESGVAVLPEEKVHPDPLAESPATSSGTSGIYDKSPPPKPAAPLVVPTVIPESSILNSDAPNLAPALGAFVGSTPVTSGFTGKTEHGNPEVTPIGTAIDAQPKSVVGVHDKESGITTGVPAIPIGSIGGEEAIRHGDVGDLHENKGAALGLDSLDEKALPATPAPAPTSAPGSKANGVGSTPVSNGNGSVQDKTTGNSEPHPDVTDEYAAVGHGTLDQPGSASSASDADKNEEVGSAGRKGSTSSSKKSGFLTKMKNKIEAKIHHD